MIDVKNNVQVSSIEPVTRGHVTNIIECSVDEVPKQIVLRDNFVQYVDKLFSIIVKFSVAKELSNEMELESAIALLFSDSLSEDEVIIINMFTQAKFDYVTKLNNYLDSQPNAQPNA